MAKYSYTSRPWRDETDYEQMRSMLRIGWQSLGHLAHITIGDLDWWRSTTNDPEIMSKVQLWFTSAEQAPEELVAFVWPGVNQIDLMTHPQHRELEAQIFDWAESQWRAAVIPHTASASEATQGEAKPEEPFVIWSYDADIQRQTFLLARGYQRNAEEFLTLHHYPLDPPPVTRSLPDSYAVRSLAGEDELQARVDVHRAAFHPSKMTVEKHRKVMASPTYRPELDLVVEAPEGGFAACTIAWFDEINQIGLFEPVACHPAHQRKGLASAMMVEGMQRLYALGARVAYVNSHRYDTPGAHTYRTLGFTVVDRVHAWEKKRV